MSMFMFFTGPEIRALREDLGESLKAFATRFSVHESTACRWELDETTPPRKAIEELNKLRKKTRRRDLQHVGD